MYGAANLQKLIAGYMVMSLLAWLTTGCGAREMPPTPTPVSQESALPDWQQRWEKTLAAARQERQLIIYGDTTPLLREALMGFQSRYGITLEFVVGRANELVAKWASEKKAGLSIADVFHLGSGSVFTMKPLGGPAPIEPYLILPDARDPKLWFQGGLPFIDADKTAIMLNRAYTSYVTVNTDVVKEGHLKSYRDLLRPEWKGKVVLYDPSITGAAQGWVVFLMKDIWGVEVSKEFFREFAATAPAVTRDRTQLIESVARGKYPIGVGVSSAATSDYKARGAPVGINRFVEGGSINPGSGAVEVPPAPPHPNAAALYINWLLTEEGQAAFARGISSPPVRVGVNIEGLDPGNVPLPGEKVFIYREEHTRFSPEAARIVKEILGDLLR